MWQNMQILNIIDINSNGFIIYFGNNYHWDSGDCNIAKSCLTPVVPCNENQPKWLDFFWPDELPSEKRKNIKY